MKIHRFKYEAIHQVHPWVIKTEMLDRNLRLKPMIFFGGARVYVVT